MLARPLDIQAIRAKGLIIFEQPKLVLLPGRQRGGPEILGPLVRGRGAGLRVTAAQVTFKTQPVS